MADTLLIEALKNAHALESKITQLLSKQLDDIEEYPDVRQQVEKHLEETKHHVELVEQCLSSLGEDPSTIQSATSSLMGNLEGMLGGATKNVVALSAANFATENLEIATYRAIQKMADHFEHSSVSEMCDTILDDEEEMANWLENNLDSVVSDFIMKESDTHR